VREAAFKDWTANNQAGFCHKKIEATRPISGRVELVKKSHPHLSLRKQCKLLSLSRSTLHYKAMGRSATDREHMKFLKETYLKDPTAGAGVLYPCLRDVEKM